MDELNDTICKNYDKVETSCPHWDIYLISMLDGEGCKCSKCGFEGVPYWEYCPNCGSYMKGFNKYGRKTCKDFT